MKMLNILFVLLVISLSACVKPTPISPAPPVPPDTPIVEDAVFEMIWTTRLDPNGSIVQVGTQQVYKDHFITFGDIGDPATIFGYNTVTGDLDWTYRYEGVDNTNIDAGFLFKSTLVGVTGKRVFGFNLDNLSVDWEINLRSLGWLRGTGTIEKNGKFYLKVFSDFNTEFQTINLLEVDAKTGGYELILSLPPDSIGMKNISPPAFWQNSKIGQTLMVLNVYPDAQLPPEQTSQNIMAVDLKTRRVVWKMENFTENFYSNSLHPPILYNDIVITGGDWSIYAFDVRTGEQLWRRQIPGYDKFGIFASTNHLIHDGRLYVNDTGDNLTCLNPETGAIIWNSKDAPNCTDNMVYYGQEDLLVFTSWGYGSVMVLDALTGETIHRERPYENSSYNNDVVYDKETDMFFTSTYKHAVGFKVHRVE